LAGRDANAPALIFYPALPGLRPLLYYNLATWRCHGACCRSAILACNAIPCRIGVMACFTKSGPAIVSAAMHKTLFITYFDKMLLRRQYSIDEKHIPRNHAVGKDWP
jgi:hypothetical protein